MAADDFSMLEALLGMTPPGQVASYLRNIGNRPDESVKGDVFNLPGADKRRREQELLDNERRRLQSRAPTPPPMAAPAPAAQAPAMLSPLDQGGGISALPTLPTNASPDALPAPGRGGGAIPGAVRAANGAPATTPYSGVISDLEARRKLAMGDLEKYSQPPDYSGMADYARTRSQTYLPQALAATLMGMGPQAAQPMAKIAAGQAEEAISPIKVEGGFVSPSGKAMIDPGFMRQKELDRVNTNLRNIDAMLSQTISREQHDQLLREQVKLRQQQAGIAAADRAERTKIEREKLQAERWVHVVDPTTGQITLYDRGAKEPTFRTMGGAAGGVDPTTGLPFVPKLTETQAKALNAGTRMANAVPLLADLLDKGYQPNRRDALAQATMGSMMGVGTEMLASDSGKAFYGAGRDILAALLRKESGAAISQGEWNQFAPLWLPWYSDTPELRQQKMERLESMFNLMQAESGPAGANYIRAVRGRAMQGGASGDDKYLRGERR